MEHKEAYAYLTDNGYEKFPVICFLLQTKKQTLAEIARKASVSRQFVSQVVQGRSDSPKVKDAIAAVLGFNPWG